MKKLILSSFVCISLFTQAQVQTPKASPVAKIEQRAGLTDITISYSRPAVNGRKIFGELIPFGVRWRLGANENTKITTSDVLIFGSDTLQAGTYALFATPNQDSWAIDFYTETTNWGLPEKWETSKVALTVIAKVKKMPMVTENLSISIDNMEFNSAVLSITWDKTQISLPFTLNTKEKVLASIEKVLSASVVTANDYNQAASYYFTEQIDMKKALEWSTKAVEMKGVSAYWMTRLKSQIQAANGDLKGAIETAKISLAEAEKDGDQNYVRMNQLSIEEWSKKK
ncbi:MAG: DUF2911 domain-containing protein [Crocinitomicaceae bacterium]|nr:DUF2911 domain-containing protein [Crocinitomicaceae bacterium]MBP6032987.1 DUF2911 domain-containing protein [Crocinitomicaceae bacterium]